MSILIPGARLRMRALQLRLDVAGPQPLKDELISWDDSCRPDLRWWSIPRHLNGGIPLNLPHPRLLLFTDASDSGWGAFAEDRLSGMWSWDVLSLFDQPPQTPEYTFSSPGFSPSPAGSVCLTVHGHYHSYSSLNVVAQAILRLCEANALRLLPQFVSGKFNMLADSLSRGSQVIDSEWTLCQEACLELFHRWPITIALFATSLNHCLQVYFAPMMDQQSSGTDAMMQRWDNLQAYAFPPFGFILRVLAKVRQSRDLEVTLVAPFWPLRPWFPDL